MSNAKGGSGRSGGGEEKALSDIQIVDSLANFLPCDSGKIASSFSCSVFFLAAAECEKVQLHSMSYLSLWCTISSITPIIGWLRCFFSLNNIHPIMSNNP